MPHSPIGSPEYCREVREESRKRILDSRARSGKLGDVDTRSLAVLESRLATWGRTESRVDDPYADSFYARGDITSGNLHPSGDAVTEAPKPYGKVKYADPANGKYPIDTKKHIKAAWAFINQAKNAAQYSVPELAKVRKAIISAAKSAGIQIADDGTSRSKGDGDWLSRRQEAELLAQHDAAMIRRYNERKAAMVGPDGPTYSERMRARELVNANSPEPRSVSHDYPHLPGRAATNR